jgi:hypothetical protein
VVRKDTDHDSQDSEEKSSKSSHDKYAKAEAYRHGSHEIVRIGRNHHPPDSPSRQEEQKREKIPQQMLVSRSAASKDHPHTARTFDFLDIDFFRG